MFPRATIDSPMHSISINAIFLSKFALKDTASCISLAGLFNYLRCQFRSSVLLAAQNLAWINSLRMLIASRIKAMLFSVLSITTGCYPFKIAETSIRFNSILVIANMARWSRAFESSQDKYVNENLSCCAVTKVDSQVTVTRRKLQASLCPFAVHAPKIRDGVIRIALNLFPSLFHPITKDRMTPAFQGAL